MSGSFRPPVLGRPPRSLRSPRSVRSWRSLRSRPRRRRLRRLPSSLRSSRSPLWLTWARCWSPRCWSPRCWSPRCWSPRSRVRVWPPWSSRVSSRFCSGFCSRFSRACWPRSRVRVWPPWPCSRACSRFWSRAGASRAGASRTAGGSRSAAGFSAARLGRRLLGGGLGGGLGRGRGDRLGPPAAALGCVAALGGGLAALAGAGGGLRRRARRRAGLGRLDGLDELGLLHLARARDPHATGHRLQVGEQHGAESTTALPGSVGSGGSGVGFDGFRHVRSFPRSVRTDPGAVGFWSLLLTPGAHHREGCRRCVGPSPTE